MTSTRTATTAEVEAVVATVATCGYYKTVSAIMRETGLSRTRTVRALEAAAAAGTGHELAHTPSGTYFGVKKSAR